jgi:acyl-coenzyme A synthetase/AMP-(fatty) acid ligase
MAAYENIAQRILRIAKDHAEESAIVIPVRSVSYDDFAQLILSYTQRLSRGGVGPQSLVAIDLDNVVMRFAVTLACALVGAPWVEGTPPVVRERKLPYTHLVFGVDKPYTPSSTQFRIDASWSKTPPGAPHPLRPAGPEDIWTYSQSSGTTGTPKFMETRHNRIEEGFERGFNLRDGERPIAAWLSPSTSGRTSTALRVLTQGGCVVAGVDYKLFQRAGVNRVSGSPVQYANLLDGQSKPEKKLYLAQITGAAAAESLLVRMLDYFERVLIRYGSTEIGIVAERAIESAPVDPSNVGQLTHDAEVEIVDGEDRPVPTGQDGIVRIRRPNRAPRGYVGAEEVTKRVFREGWFYPGDIGRLSDNGDLFIVGRTDDRLNLGGVKVDAGRVDALIQNTPGIRDGYCFEDREESGMTYLALLFSLDGGLTAEKVVPEIIRAMGASGPFYRVHRAYVASEIPRTATGKPLRRLAPDFVRKAKPFTIVLKEPGKA